MTGPYGSAALLYRGAGWDGVLPLPAQCKKHPPRGWTGHGGATPSTADVHAWIDAQGDGNIALRLPKTVIGIDVDAYADKQGKATLAQAEADWGPLPPTWRSTSRDDGVSGIYLFRVPTGGTWPGEVGPGVEVIRWCHRYAVVWPSVHPEGRVYRWVTPDGEISDTLPRPDDLPELPQRWVDGLTTQRREAAAGPFVLPDVIPAGVRDQVIFDYARSLRDRGVKASQAQRLAVLALQRCEQPTGNVFTERQALAKVDSAYAFTPVELPPVSVLTPSPYPVTARLSDVTPEHVDWLWDGRLPRGKIVVLDGDPGVGKSTCAIDWAAHVSTGACWPDGAPNSAGVVLLLSAEDGLADTIRPRLDAARGDASAVHALKGIGYTDEKGATRTRPVTLADIAEIESEVRRLGVALVIVDVLMAYLPGKIDSHRDQDVRAVLSDLAAMAERTNCCVLLLRHLNKSGGGSAIYRGGGSIGIIGAARLGLLAAVDPEDEDKRVLAATKSNLAAMPDALAYRLVESPEHRCARVDWLGTSTHSAGALLATPGSEQDIAEADELVAQLHTILDDSNGEIMAADGIKRLRQMGAMPAKDTLYRARRRAGIDSHKSAYGAGWVWSYTVEGSAKVLKGRTLTDPEPSDPSPNLGPT